ncbi:ammonia-dependent NAD(+) synthetase [Niallia nealsonii]|uniref:NH(3)-dependent NAD(+) synthetase n=1 Tax=Niallia nealsonii TaxID=115979 RepID=A0A2N0YWJ1_9BACI|nr:ammonia-dependent NAD(+) synthetase [Niallia nealsonii]PKG21631.1 NAD(+) synthase [Niallia nealsonii]
MQQLQKQIIEEMKVAATINPKEEIRVSVDFLKNYLIKHPFLNGFVLGISGGQDSTLVGKLAQRAVAELNKEEDTNKYMFYAVRLPYGTQADEKDCQDAIEFINPTKVFTVNIKPAVNASVDSLVQAGVLVTDFIKGNEKARERMKVQYSIAGTYNLAVLGTDHSAEAVTGFFTKYGDGGADLTPIFRLNKRQGKMLLKELNCPEQLYKKIPTADLEENRPQLADENALGVSYEEIDDYLEGKIINKESSDKIESWYLKTQHKRNPPITVFDDFWK